MANNPLEVDITEFYQQVVIDENGNIKSKPLKTNNDILKEFLSWDDVNTTLWNSLNNGKPPAGVKINSVNNCVQGVFNTVKTIDNLGKAIKLGCPCVTCGKHVDFMPSNGYCSIECAAKDLAKRLFSHLSKGDNPWQKYIDAVQDTLNFLDLVLNVVMELPLKLKDIALLPPEYAKFLTLKINIVFLKIRIMINKLMIFKNEMIIKMLKPAQLGVIYDYIAGLFGPINLVITLVQLLLTALNTTFGFAMKLITSLGPTFTLPAGSFAWVTTPRSIIRNPVNNLLYVLIPADGIPSISSLSSAINCLNVLAISNTVLKLFPPIIPLEYFMKPELFDVRLALSDLGDIVKKTIESLELVLKLSPEYLPRYKDLKITNIWFVVATLIGWAPKAQESYGSFINPFS